MRPDRRFHTKPQSRPNRSGMPVRWRARARTGRKRRRGRRFRLYREGGREARMRSIRRKRATGGREFALSKFPANRLFGFTRTTQPIDPQLAGRLKYNGLIIVK